MQIRDNGVLDLDLVRITTDNLICPLARCCRAGADMHRRLDESGPQGPGTPTEDFCQKYWWTNMLYISNFYPGQIAHKTQEGYQASVRQRSPYPPSSPSS